MSHDITHHQRNPRLTLHLKYKVNASQSTKVKSLSNHLEHPNSLGQNHFLNIPSICHPVNLYNILKGCRNHEKLNPSTHSVEDIKLHPPRILKNSQSLKEINYERKIYFPISKSCLWSKFKSERGSIVSKLDKIWESQRLFKLSKKW